MADIQEIPLESEAPVEKGEGKNQNDEEIAEDIAPAQEDIPPKRGRGRPPGAKNRPKKPEPKPPPPAPKPKAIRKKKPPPPQYEEYSSESSEYEAPRQRSTRDLQQERQALAGEVLGLLSAQRNQRSVARRNHYASWFQNM